MQKFQMVNWVPAKLGKLVWFSRHLGYVKLKAVTVSKDIPVNVDDELLLDEYLSSGKQDGEVEIEEEGRSSSWFPFLLELTHTILDRIK
jgi:hypothetical protein